GDHAFSVAGDLLQVDRWLAALIALEEPARGELDEVAVAGRGGGQERQVEAVEAARSPARVVLDDVDLAAEDRLDPVLATRREKLDGAVHHAVVCQSQCRLLVRGSPRR